MSAPVYGDGGAFLGLVDALDILAFTCHLFDTETGGEHSLFARLATESKFSKAKIGDVTGGLNFNVS